MVENRLLEPLERLRRLEAELAEQALPQGRIGGERVRLATAAVERQHQLLVQALAQGLAPHELLQLGDELVVAAERHIGRNPVLEHRPLLRKRPQRSEHIGVGIEGDHADAILGTELLDEREGRLARIAHLLAVAYVVAAAVVAHAVRSIDEQEDAHRRPTLPLRLLLD